MAAKQHVLPVNEPARPPQKPVLHNKYLVDLLDEHKNPDSPYYAGDIYNRSLSDCAKRWKADTHGRYLDLVRKSSKAFPDLAHLASWMEVSTTVSRYKYLEKHLDERKERAQRVHVCQIDFKKGQQPSPTHFSDQTRLAAALSNCDSTEKDIDARVYVVEDLSRAVIELFGSTFGIDPHFFRAHINDYMWNTDTGDAVELKHLDMLGRRQSYFRVSYLRPRYYPNTAAFEEATRQAGRFNVLRQLDSDRSRQNLMNEEGAVGLLMRAKASVWHRPVSAGECVVVLLLVDPTVTAGSNLWNGYNPFENWTAESAETNEIAPPRTSFFDDVVYWTCRLRDPGIDEMKLEPKACVSPLLCLILSDLQHVVQYVTAQLGQIEWEIALPSMRQNPEVDGTMQKLHPWRRNVTLYRAMVAHAMDRIFSKKVQREANENDPDYGLPALLRDFQIILQDIDTIQYRIERIVSVATALQSIEESRRAMQQNQNVARLTYLATFFIPLTFVSGILSMVPDVTTLKTTFWIFFVIAVPLTATALVIADFLRLRTKFGETIREGEGEALVIHAPYLASRNVTAKTLSRTILRSIGKTLLSLLYFSTLEITSVRLPRYDIDGRAVQAQMHCLPAKTGVWPPH